MSEHYGESESSLGQSTPEVPPMLKWVASKVEAFAVDAAIRDMTNFTAGLQGQDSEGMGMTVAIATCVRIDMQRVGILHESLLTVVAPDLQEQQGDTLLAVLSLAKRYQREQMFADAAGAMVWLHTLRAFVYPQVRVHGKRMWAELMRGIPYSLPGLEKLRLLTGKPIEQEHYLASSFIPVGLEPFD